MARRVRSLRVLCAGRTRLRTHRTALHPFALDFTRTLRVDYLHSGGPGGEALKLDAVIAEGAWPGNPDTAHRPDRSRQVLLRGRRSRVEARASTRAGLRRFTASGKRRLSFAQAIARFTSRCGFPGRARPCVSPSRNATARTCSCRSGRSTSIRIRLRGGARLTARAERLSAYVRKRSGKPQGRPAA